LAFTGTFLCMATGSFAQTVPFTIVSGDAPGGTYGIMGGVYTSPYTASVGGNTVAAICDDFSDEVSPGESWTAIATNLATLDITTPTAAVYWDQGEGATQQTAYMVTAYLAEELLAINQSTTTGQTTAGELSFALWGVFDPTLLTAANPAGLTTGTGGQLAAAENYLTSAESAVNTAITKQGLNNYLSTFSNVTIYSATINNGVPAESENSSRPQEFIVVNMAEPPSPALLGLDLLGAAGLLLFARRRWVGRTSPS
jgi:hypothetical protein